MNYYIFTSIINHPPFMTKQTPAMISKWRANISWDKECLDKAAPDYNNVVKNSSFNKNIKFTPQPSKRRKRSRNILWFNLLFSSNVKINLGKIFLQLLARHYPKRYKYYKLFNINNVKKKLWRTWQALFKTTKLIYWKIP